MLRSIFALLVISTTLLAGGCSQSAPTETASLPPPLAPFTAMKSIPGNRLHAADLLCLDDEELYGRPEKFVYGAIPYTEFSAFTTYTYDAQPIGTLNGSGYRYRWTVQSGLSAPLAP